MGNNDIRFDKDTDNIVEASKVKSFLVLDETTGLPGAVEFDLVVNEAGKRVADAVKVTGDVLPTLGDANKRYSFTTGSAGRTLTWTNPVNSQVVPFTFAGNKQCSAFWDGVAKVWTKEDEVELPQEPTVKNFNSAVENSPLDSTLGLVLDQKIVNLKSDLSDDSLPVYIGVNEVIAGTGNTSVLRTRVDNRFKIIEDGLFLKEISIRVTTIGAVEILFVEKTNTIGLYTIVKSFPISFTNVGNVTITESVFGENYELPKDSYFGIKLITASIDTFNTYDGQSNIDGSSFQLVGTGSVATSVATSSISVLDFKLKTVKKVLSTEAIKLRQVEFTNELNQIHNEVRDVGSRLDVSNIYSIGYEILNNSTHNSSLNRTRIDGNYLSTKNGKIKDLNVAFAVAGTGSVKLVKRNIDGTFLVKKSIPFNFISGINNISAELWQDQEIEIGDTFAFYSETGAISLENNSSAVTYYCIGNLTNSTGLASLVTSSGVLKFNYTIEVNEGDRMNYIQGQIDDLKGNVNINKKGYLSYNSSNKTFTFYNRKGDSNYYLSYQIQQVIDHSDLVYLDIYRLNGGAFFKREKGAFNKVCNTINSPENEFAIKFQGKYDYTGGYHGDERIDVIEGSFAKFFANGQEINDLSNSFFIECESFSYLQKSSLHESGNTESSFIENHPQIAWHLKECTILNNKINIKNSVEFLSNQTAVSTHAFLFCVHKDVATKAILPTAQMLNLTNTNITISATNGVDNRAIKLWNPLNTVLVETYGSFIKGLTNDSNDISTYVIWDRANDSKPYIRCDKPRLFVNGSLLINEQTILFH